MSNKPLITIIAPFYNGAHYLPECVESILAQDYQNLEIILVDDGSTDNTLTLLQKYAQKDRRITVIHQENRGVSAARNNGLDHAHGKYICFIDGDDTIDKTYITHLYSLITKGNSEISLLPQPFRFSAATKHRKPTEKAQSPQTISGLDAAQHMFYYHFAIGSWNKMINRELIERHHLRFHEDLPGGEGFVFSEECYRVANRVIVGNLHLYNYRLDNQESCMTEFRLPVIKSSIRAQKYLQKLYSAISPEMDHALKYANWHTYCDYLNTFIGCKVRKQYYQQYKQIQKVCKKDATCVFHADIPFKEKLKGIIYLISPFLAAKIINRLRLRKFTAVR